MEQWLARCIGDVSSPNVFHWSHKRWTEEERVEALWDCPRGKVFWKPWSGIARVKRFAPRSSVGDSNTLFLACCPSEKMKKIVIIASVILAVICIVPVMLSFGFLFVTHDRNPDFLKIEQFHPRYSSLPRRK